MTRGSRKSNKIVPGRHMLSDQMQLHYLGMADTNHSYLAEKTADESSLMDCSREREERMWRKQGLTEKQIFRIQEDRVLKKHADAEARLEREKYGAKTFEEMLALSQYAIGALDVGEDDEPDVSKRENVFAIPALPKHVKPKSTMMSPAVRTTGKPGFGCSTPKGGKDLSMQALKTLDISHVINTDDLQSKKVNVQEKNVRISLKRTSDHANEEVSLEQTHTIRRDEDSELQGTFTVQKEGEGSLQGTFTVANDAEAEQSLQGTFVKEPWASMLCGTEDERDNGQSSGLQGTFVKESAGIEDQSQNNGAAENRNESESLQGTFVKAVDAPADAQQTKLNNTLDLIMLISNESNAAAQMTVSEGTVIVENTMEGGKSRRKSKKTDLNEREKRMADMTSSLINSMIDDAPSPGAALFKNTRKKIRPTVATPPRTRISRVSIESDKEKTIEMLSIAEEPTLEATGTSFVDPISVNGSRISPIPEHKESHPPVITATPKSSRRTGSLREQSVEKSRATGPSMRLSVASPFVGDSVIDTPVRTTPSRNYEKPTFASLAKSKNSKVVNLCETEKGHPEKQMSQKTLVRTPVLASKDFKDPEDDQLLGHVSVNTSDIPPRSEVQQVQDDDDPTVFPVTSNISIRNIEGDLNALSVNERNTVPVDYDMDFDDDDRQDPEMDRDEEEVEAEEEQVPARIGRQKPRSRRLGLLSDSIASVNTPGIAENRRPTRTHRPTDDTVVDDGWNSDEEYEDVPRRSRRNDQVGLQLAKRKLIKPADNDDGLRRSTRTRVKPVRSWLGEQPVYANSPSGGRRMTGVTDVYIKDKRLCKYRTADLGVATEREQRARAMKRARAEQKRRQLAHDQSMGRRLNESQDEIVTSEDEQ